MAPTAKSARRRQELVDTAFAVFAEQGYAATTVADITTRLGVSQGTFYRYFDGKRDILDEVVDLGVERFMLLVELDEAPAPLSCAQDLLDRVRELAGRVLDLAEAEPGLARLVMLEATSVDDELTHRLMGLLDLFAGLGASYLDEAVEAGVLREGVPTDVLSDALVGMLLPSLVLAFRGELDRAARDAQIDALLGVISRGILRPEKQK